ncbi:MAG: 50S ribosomal protein L11 methyltransferase [Halofilum sp. (in: g-proteobacteria)]|nr:50S ribosomal protein L11 methyltransferase [Halofilum sp. (in: g-proteobacteria)]
MPWLQVKVDSDPEHAPAVEEALIGAGAVSVTFEDAGDAPILEPGPGEMPLWTATRLVALFDEQVARDTVADALARLGHAEAHAPAFEQLPDREWSRAWLDDWQPLRFGRHLWVAPLEATVDDPAATVVRLDPGLAFGTGTHATTALCLEWLEAQAPAGASVLDFGCGSGILAIAALRLGAAAAHGIDVDPQALEASRANAATNAVAGRLSLAEGDSPATGGPYDLVVANILAGPLVQAAAPLARQQEAGGRIALAGILREQADDVVRAFEPAYGLAIGAERDGWVLLTGTRRAA